MQGSYRKLVGLTALVLLICAGTLWAQKVFTAQQRQPVMLEPPGNGNTQQNFFSQTGTGAASAITLVQPANAAVVNYLTGFEITGGGATAASVITVTITENGVTQANYNIAVPAGATAGITPLVVEFTQPLKATGSNIDITLNVPSFGAGNTVSSATMHGFTE